jgi:hypothetical protein
MDYKNLKEECDTEGPNSCTGPRHCVNREFDSIKKDCQRCMADYFKAIESL